MIQPSKRKESKKVVTKKRKLTRSEIIKRNIERSKKPHPQYGTSKLETKFATEFLDKLGIKYITQYEAKDIKRFYDFYLPDSNILIEIDGDYW